MEAENIEEARNLFNLLSNTFIQWKGTDLCMDFHCKCGEHNHYDGYFAYQIICANCKTVYALGQSIELIELKKPYGNYLEPID